MDAFFQHRFFGRRDVLRANRESIQFFTIFGKELVATILSITP